MRKSKWFRLLHLAVLLAFFSLGAVLAVRLRDLERGHAFYQQINTARDHSPVLPVSLPVPARPTERAGLSLQVSRLSAEYPDAAAWLQIPGTSLDYPVMLGQDNQFYLDHLPDGSKNPLGSLFLDHRSRTDGPHWIIYGHNGSNGSMFGLLKKYESRDFWAEHPTLTAAGPDTLSVCPIFSVRRVEAGGSAYQLEFADRAAFLDYVNQAAADSLYPIDVAAGDAAGVLTLSTCTGRQGQRFLVQALLPAA